MNIFVVCLIMFVVGIAGTALLNMSPANLKIRFGKAGILAGRTKEDIILAVGPPTSTTGVGGGKTVLQWMEVSQTGSYHVALIFDANGICEGVSHEHDGTGF